MSVAEVHVVVPPIFIKSSRVELSSPGLALVILDALRNVEPSVPHNV